MSFFFFFNNRKTVHFEHKPVYYDPKKDLHQSNSDKELNPIQGRFIQGTNHLKKKKKRNQSFYRSIIRLIIIILILIVLSSIILS
ncbi:MAG: hypothetical protein LBG15_03915 [Dysgonamonadaceae bacterium]|jgi:hypothetical protein|nr:hypothetical protein [Dysgonamonadaceae bacterium]